MSGLVEVSSGSTSAVSGMHYNASMLRRGDKMASKNDFSWLPWSSVPWTWLFDHERHVRQERCLPV